jgi:hypothetical protein
VQATAGRIVRPVIRHHSDNHRVYVEDAGQLPDLFRTVQPQPVHHDGLLNYFHRNDFEARDRLQFQIVSPRKFEAVNGGLTTMIKKRHDGDPGKFGKWVIDCVLYMPAWEDRTTGENQQ